MTRGTIIGAIEAPTARRTTPRFERVEERLESAPECLLGSPYEDERIWCAEAKDLRCTFNDNIRVTAAVVLGVASAAPRVAWKAMNGRAKPSPGRGSPPTRSRR
jgi:hypothetical protein